MMRAASIRLAPRLPRLVPAALIALIALGGMAPAQTPSEISGRIVNGTTGQPLADFTFYLMQPGQRGMEPVRTLRTGPGGRFVLPDAASLVGSPHVLQAEYRGINYNHSLRPVGQLTDIDLTVYELTDSMEGMRVSLPHMVVRREGAALRVDEIYQIENESKPPRSFVTAQGSFFFHLPAEGSRLRGVAVSTAGSSMPLQQTPNENADGDGYNITNPLKPGRTQIQVSYEVDYRNEHVHLPRRFFYPLETINVFISPEDMEARSDALRDAGIDRQNGFRVLTADAVPARKEIVLDLSGGSARGGTEGGAAPSRGGQGDIVRFPPVLARYNLLIIFNLVVLLAAFVGWRLTAGSAATAVAGGGETEADLSHGKLMKKRQAIVAQLAALDDRWDAGSLTADEYGRQRHPLKQQLGKLQQALEQGKTAKRRP